MLIDSGRPGDIVADCLTRAEAVLSDGLSGTNENDLIEEFLAYWNPSCDGGAVRSICRPGGPSREICLLHHHLSAAGGDTILACDSCAEGMAWLANATVACKQEDKGWFHSLATPFLPPDFEDRLLTRNIVEAVTSHSSESDCRAFKNWLTGHGLPCTVIYCMTTPATDSSLLFAVTFNSAVGNNRKEALKGFRPHTLPPLREFAHTLRQKVTRLSVDRLDWDYLLPRAGGSSALRNKTVAIIGCGAVGAVLAEKLACMGVGSLRLVDNETLASANIHRHALGIEHLGKNKAGALCSKLGCRFPHVTTSHKASRVQSVLADDPEYLLSSDLVCIALGDETTELWLNDALGNRVVRIHAWVEPLGIGGHVLAVGFENSPGCYRCLFKSDDAVGLYNAASFAKAGQTFTRAFAGCAGVFTPFGCLDSERTASEAARCAAAILSGDLHAPILRSWSGDRQPFLKAGFLFSQRSAIFAPGEVKDALDFKDDMCRCGSRTETV